MVLDSRISDADFDRRSAQLEEQIQRLRQLSAALREAGTLMPHGLTWSTFLHNLHYLWIQKDDKRLAHLPSPET